MLTIKRTTQFKRDFKRMVRQGYDTAELIEVIRKLANNEQLPEKYHDHELKGEWKGFRECHIKPDWLLIYLLNGQELILTLTRTGSHSDLFN